ncbi:polyprenol reductase-like [Homarus americanus]|uniref:polyprenol reductase-like n=1 Tax=Homarus americanus TaxID=6706 RepID=UPI001C4815E7|nr:polyprenol reductase-like [Homarus americanus]XP_042231006.1 polyprenol reductase-like [Homarus americanus]XP_042231007.1 polyprenol reductase-like [Homarus americanus]
MTKMAITDTIFDLLLEWDLSRLMFIVYLVIISLSGTLVNFFREMVPLPHFFLQAFKYGKMAHSTHVNTLISRLEVPKKWFVHFYISASLVVTVAFMQTWCVYVSRSPLSSWFSVVLDVLTTPHRSPTVSGTSAALGLCLLAAQIYRRLYENLYINVFSFGHINVFHYIVGHTHYLGAAALLLSQAPGFDGTDSHISFSALDFWHVIGTIICIYGFTVQNKSLRLLAALRKHKDKNMKEKHVIPQGGMFEVVSCPHMFAEVVVYVGILIVLRTHMGWGIVTLWVMSNQIQVAVMNHRWYQKTFKDYPRSRRAIFPFLL